MPAWKEKGGKEGEGEGRGKRRIKEREEGKGHLLEWVEGIGLEI